MMKDNRIAIHAAVVLLAVNGTGSAADGLGFALEVTPLSQYVWRGLVETNGPVLQTSSTVSYRGAHLNLFTNQDLSDVNRRLGRVNELDFDLGYDYIRRNTTFSAGAIRYTFPGTSAASTTELYAGAGLTGWLNPSVRGYFDVDSIRGAYWSGDVSHRFTLAKLPSDMTWDLILAAGAGFGSANHNAAYYGVKQAAFADLHPSVSLPLSHGKLLLTPRLAYGMLLDPALRGGSAAKAHGFSAGISFAVNL